MSKEPSTSELFELAAKGTAGLSQSLYSKTHHRPDAVFVAVGCVIGALTSLALVIGENPGDDTDSEFDAGKRVNDVTMLFGALLAVEATTCCGSKKLDSNTSAAGHEIEFSPAVVMAALDSYEKLTGRKPDAKLCTSLVQSARMGAESGAVLLSKFLKSRPVAPGSNTQQ